MKYIIVLLSFFMFTNISYAQDLPMEGTEEGIKLEKEIENKMPKQMALLSASSKNKPLWVVEGIVVESDFFAKEMDEKQIAKINVLKGAAATTLYGTSGANGVIEVTLKEKYKKKFKKKMNKK